MPTEKKRPSKQAKARAKLLQENELLAAKKAEDKAAETIFNPAETEIKLSGANKLRPEKKRG